MSAPGSPTEGGGGQPTNPSKTGEPGDSSERLPRTKIQDKPQADKLQRQGRTPGEFTGQEETPPERLQMPAPDEGIEPLISWALQDRQQTIERMRKKVAMDGDQADETPRAHRSWCWQITLARSSRRP